MSGVRENPVDILPELFLLGGAVVGLLAALFLPRHRQWVVAVSCLAGTIASLVAAGLAVRTSELATFDVFMLDPITNVTRITVAGATLLILAMAVVPLHDHPRQSEFLVLTLLAALGAVALAGTTDLLVLVAAYVLASIPAYALAGFAKDGAGTEAAMKYFLMGAFLGVLMLLGVTLLYGTGRATEYGMLAEGLRSGPTGVVAAGAVGVFAGVLFKAGGVPAHYWIPDVTEGAPRLVAAFVTTVPKLGALAAAFRLAEEVLATTAIDWRLFIAIVATATMTLGNLAAFLQDNVRRLLAYSTISQAGYILLPVAVAGRGELAEPALLFYLAAYAVTNLGAFAVVLAAGRDDLPAYTGLARRSGPLALSLTVCLLGFVGTPPTAVFVGKVLAFAAAIDGGYTWLAVVAAVNSVASVFYYLRWIVPLFSPSRPEEAAALARPAMALAHLCAAGTLVLGLAAGLTI